MLVLSGNCIVHFFLFFLALSLLDLCCLLRLQLQTGLFELLLLKDFEFFFLRFLLHFLFVSLLYLLLLLLLFFLDIELAKGLKVISLLFNVGGVRRNVHIVEIIRFNGHRELRLVANLDALDLFDRRRH